MRIPSQARTGVFKRRPLEDCPGWEKLSKADWFDAYVDLYRQTHDAEAHVSSAVLDAIKRHHGPLAPLRLTQAEQRKLAALRKVSE